MNDPLPDLDTVVRAVRHLPPLPAVAAEVVVSLGDTDGNAERVADLLARDTALAARTLRVANSPYYGLQGQIGSVQEAVVVLGLASIRSLVVASTLTQVFAGRLRPEFDQLRFWKHSLATAAAAGEVGRLAGADSGICFVAGVMHEVGRLALYASFPAVFDAILDRRRAHGLGWAQAEREVLGFDHAGVGGALCDYWRFPSVIGAAVAGHCLPGKDDADVYADVLHVANAIARALDLGGEDDAAVPPLSEAAWERLDPGWNDLQQVLAATERQFDALAAMLG